MKNADWAGWGEVAVPAKNGAISWRSKCLNRLEEEAERRNSAHNRVVMSCALLSWVRRHVSARIAPRSGV